MGGVFFVYFIVAGQMLDVVDWWILGSFTVLEVATCVFVHHMYPS